MWRFTILTSTLKACDGPTRGLELAFHRRTFRTQIHVKYHFFRPSITDSNRESERSQRTGWLLFSAGDPLDGLQPVTSVVLATFLRRAKTPAVVIRQSYFYRGRCYYFIKGAAAIATRRSTAAVERDWSSVLGHAVGRPPDGIRPTKSRRSSNVNGSKTRRPARQHRREHRRSQQT
jgi:hypothetical protein